MEKPAATDLPIRRSFQFVVSRNNGYLSEVFDYEGENMSLPKEYEWIRPALKAAAAGVEKIAMNEQQIFGGKLSALDLFLRSGLIHFERDERMLKVEGSEGHTHAALGGIEWPGKPEVVPMISFNADTVDQWAAHSGFLLGHELGEYLNIKHGQFSAFYRHAHFLPNMDSYFLHSTRSLLSMAVALDDFEAMQTGIPDMRSIVGRVRSHDNVASISDMRREGFADACGTFLSGEQPMHADGAMFSPLVLHYLKSAFALDMFYRSEPMFSVTQRNAYKAFTELLNNPDALLGEPVTSRIYRFVEQTTDLAKMDSTEFAWAKGQVKAALDRIQLLLTQAIDTPARFP